jgi:isopentenyl-diphosphate delta-isomerase
MEYVVLVDEQDKEIGTMEKLQAHVEGRLHRAVSVFIFNTKGELLLQQRAEGKYHSAGLLTNTCCSHPRPGEGIHDAAVRRLQEEMGITCQLKEVFSFTYKAYLDHNLTEHEFDHVFTGITDAIPKPDKSEAGGWKYMSMEQLEEEIKTNPEQFTEWFKICVKDWKKELFGK